MCGIYGTTLKYSESGIIPFLMRIVIYLSMFKRSLPFFKSDVHLPLVAVSVMGILVITHNYFANEILIYISILLLVRLGDKSNTMGVVDDAEDVSILRSL